MPILIASTNPIYTEGLVKSLKESLLEKIEVISKKEELTLEYLKQVNPSFIFFPHWSHIIPAEVFENYACIVFHMTDLPFGRGGSPLQNLIVRGITETKISALKVVKELDAGPVYLKAPLSLEGTAREIFERCVPIVNDMILKILKDKINPQEQTGEVLQFKRRTPAESNLQQLSNTQEVYDYIRMLDADGYPAAYLETEKLKYEFTHVRRNADNTLNANVRITKK